MLDAMRVERAIDDYVRTNGPLSKAPITRTIDPNPFTFYPMAGTLFGDVFTTNYVDLDPTDGILDWDCTDHSYDGHDAHDVRLRSFGEQIVGVPIYAVQDGVVIATHDGEDDMNTEWLGQPANYVVIDHGNGRICNYWHMKKNSVAVTVSETVKAGQQIGLVASSGNSTAPHLHFATYENGVMREPNVGDCDTGDSLWVDQEPIRRDTYLQDLGITNQTIAGLFPPDEFPRNPHIKLNDSFIYVWIYLPNLPANSVRRHVFKRPNGSIQYNKEFPFNNVSDFRWSWWWFSFDNPGSESTIGTWTYDLYVNDELLTSVPFEVEANDTVSENRPPEPVTLALEPEAPAAEDVLVVRVLGDLILDDLDLDIVQYEYVWTVDSVEVRRLISAGRSDALPHSIAEPGSTVHIAVTPGDGIDVGPTAELEFQIAGAPLDPANVWVDFNHAGTETGTEPEPFNTLGEAVAVVEPHGTVWIQGDLPASESAETLSIDSPVTIESVGGAARIGSN